MTIRIMIADDDLPVRGALSGLLERVGFDVHTATDGATAMRLAKLLHPQLAIIDVNITTSGVEVLRQLKAHYGAAMFVAMLSDDARPETRDECFAAGADAVLSKPILPTELRRLMLAAASGLGVTTAAS